VSAWRSLFDELDRWPVGTATFWWRDDDATAATPALDRLLALSQQPLALAVIPAGVQPSLARRVDGQPVDVLQHGFAHANHEPLPAKKAELGRARSPSIILAELAEGRRRLQAMFGSRALPVLVPPWNRIDEELAAMLNEHGFRGLSTIRPRRPGASGPFRANVHIDIVDWRADRQFIGVEAAVALAVGHLAQRRQGKADAGEPTGLLTHHLVMNEAAYAFTGEFIARSAAHPAVHWCAARDIFPVEPAGAP
jgi:hypothetical protein